MVIGKLHFLIIIVLLLKRLVWTIIEALSWGKARSILSQITFPSVLSISFSPGILGILEAVLLYNLLLLYVKLVTIWTWCSSISITDLFPYSLPPPPQCLLGPVTYYTVNHVPMFSCLLAAIHFLPMAKFTKLMRKCVFSFDKGFREKYRGRKSEIVNFCETVLSYNYTG